jgi:hypothetical protein
MVHNLVFTPLKQIQTVFKSMNTKLSKLFETNLTSGNQTPFEI